MNRIFHYRAGPAWRRATGSTLGLGYVQGDRVVIGLSKITPAAQAAARETFAGAVRLITSAPITIKFPVVNKVINEAQPPAAPGPQSKSGGERNDDTPPFYGGDQIVAEGTYKGVTYAGGCTTSFDAYDPSANWNAMLTAGHCNLLGDFINWYSGYLVNKGGEAEVFKYDFEGYAVKSLFADGFPDAMILSQRKLGTFAAQVYYGASTWHENYPLTGSATITDGEKICTDGAYSGQQICGPVVTSTGGEIEVTEKIGSYSRTVTVGPVAIATYSKSFCIPGDSGGPVYEDNSSGKVTALGTIEGYLNSDDCVINEVGPALSNLGARLVTAG